ncbi:hypothetical protein M231_05271 [Tremella mesenterica]|uniref:Uncharacterized protein n=1 Tax=Tremella mesenterica TaxID=5217 RepID=A0A4Q1BIH6_TREME|nr:uncharacterized protein TREMEDRAFT_41083 [Tremella mesenterica DSM 1558]EIW66035.1 hypothetical protein TREMEDRAFT_41083 [Tremella mesenterica DSM 1558]RXK37448.1 hypothetical protein M231_05271 [Tremella mesenterica]
MSSSTSTIKARHYTALSARLRQLGNNLAESEAQLAAMAGQLQSMAKLGVYCGAQFMAVSRLLDSELQLTKPIEPTQETK